MQSSHPTSLTLSKPSIGGQSHWPIPGRMHPGKSYFKKLMVIVVCCIASMSTYAQQTVTRTKIHLLKQETDFQNSSALNKLVYGGRPTLYINQEQAKMTNSETPDVVDIDASSIVALSRKDPRFASTKLLIVNIKTESDKQIKLKESYLTSFPNLKNILFSSQMDLSEQEIQSMFTAKANSKISAHYQILSVAR
jgi:hypothetical protein